MCQAYDYNVSAGMRQAASEPHLLFCFRMGCFFMKPDIYALFKAGFSKERIEEIFMQYRKLPKGAEQISVSSMPWISRAF